MGTTYDNSVHLELGTSVTAVFVVKGHPTAAFCVVASEAPLYLKTSDVSVVDHDYPLPVILLWHGDGKLMRGEALAMDAYEEGGEQMIELRHVRWEDLDRRRHPRIAVSVPCALRAVHDVHGATTISLFQGTTENISLGGAWIQSPSVVEVGSLVEFQATLLPGSVFRALGVVAHCDIIHNGLGISFLDYVGTGKTLLEEFLAQAA